MEDKPTRQNTFPGRINETVKYMHYYPCVVRAISSDKTRVMIEFNTYKNIYFWEVPAVAISRTIGA